MGPLSDTQPYRINKFLSLWGQGSTWQDTDKLESDGRDHMIGLRGPGDEISERVTETEI